MNWQTIQNGRSSSRHNKNTHASNATRSRYVKYDNKQMCVVVVVFFRRRRKRQIALSVAENIYFYKVLSIRNICVISVVAFVV